MIEPRNEFELVIMFAQQCANEPDIKILSFDGTYPDALIEWKGKVYKVEFERASSNFTLHGHDPLRCDLVICWTNDTPDFILPIIALDDPNWKYTNIEEVTNLEKTVTYWRKRARQAEEELRAIKSDDIFVPTEVEEKILEMSKNNLSHRAISGAIWGQRGAFYNKRIRAVLSKHLPVTK